MHITQGTNRQLVYSNTRFPLIDNFDKYLKSSQNKETNFLDTWPCKQKLDDTDKVMFFLDDKKTMARLSESEVQKNISLLIPSAKQQYDNKNLKILTRDNLTPIIDLNSLKSFFLITTVDSPISQDLSKL
jgi:hypothetical protein